MLPANGVTAFAGEKQDGQKTSAVTRSATKTKAARSVDAEDIKLDEDSLNLKLGCIKTYHLQGIDPDDVGDIWFEGENYRDKLQVYDTYEDGEWGYRIIPKQTGEVTVTPHILTNGGEELELDPVTFKIAANDEDVVPITDINLFDRIRNELDLSEEDTNSIKKEQMKDITKLDLNYIHDINGIQYATNCETLTIQDSYNLTDISEIGYLKNLKKFILIDTNVSNVSVLKGLKNLEYVNLEGSPVGTEDRFLLIDTTRQATIEEGRETADLVYPRGGLIQATDTVTSSDPSVVSVSLHEDSDGVSRWYYKAGNGEVGKKATITIENEDQKKEIPVTVVAKKKETPAFETATYKASMACYPKIEMGDMSKVSDIKITSSDTDILDLASSWDGEEEIETYRYNPRQQGASATLTAIITMEDGTRYRDTQEVTIGETPENVVPIKSYDAFDSLNYDNEDYVTWEQLKKMKDMYLSNDSITNDDISWISKAENCKHLELRSNDELSNIKGLEKLTNLEFLDLYGTEIDDIDTLNSMKDHLQYLNIESTGIKDQDRLKLMSSEPINVCEGGKTEQTILPKGLLSEDDTVEIEDSEIADMNINEDYDNDLDRELRNVVIRAKKGMANKKTKLKITSSTGETKTIDVNVTEKDKNAPGFANETMNTSIGKFSEIKLKNMDGVKVATIPESDNQDVVDVQEETSYDYKNDEEVTHYYLEPKSKGTANITVECKINGITYEDTMKVTVGTDDTLIPIKDYNLYREMIRNWDSDQRKDHILKSESDQIVTINGAYSGITDLSGIEYATECEKVDFTKCRQLQDISKLNKLTKLKSVNLSNTKVSDISALENVKDQLTTLNLKGSKVSTEDRFAFIQTSQEIGVKAGTQKQVTIKPSGILQSGDVCSIEGDDTITAQYIDGKVMIDATKASEEKTVNLVISKEGSNAKVKLPVQIIEDNSKRPGLVKKSYDLEIGNFMKVSMKNTLDVRDITFKISDEDKQIVNVKTAEHNSKYHFVPKKEGHATIQVEFEKKDGTIYTDTASVTVKKADESQNIVPLRSLDTFDMLCDLNDLETNGTITKDQMKQVKTIELNLDEADNIEDYLAGLDQATNCEKFSVESYDESFKEIQPLLEKFKNIKDMDITIGDMSQEEFDTLFKDDDRIKNLESLYLYSTENKVKDYSALGDLKNLKKLDVDEANITNLDCIKNLTKLVNLDLSYSKLKELKGLEQLTNLKILSLRRVENVKDFSILDRLTNLEELNLAETKLSDVTPLKQLTNLKKINLENTNVSTEDRFSLIRTKEIVLEEKEVADSNGKNAFISPQGIIQSGDEVSLEPSVSGITCYKEYYNDTVTLSAKAGSVGTKTNLVIKKDGVTKSIPVSVEKEEADTPGFKTDTVKTTIGAFDEIPLKNVDVVDPEKGSYSISSADHESYEIIGMEFADKAYHFVPKKTGTAKLEGYFTAKNGKKYYRELTVEVADAPKDIVPISNFNIYEALTDENGKSVDGSISGKKDYRIDQEEIKKVAKIQGYYCGIKDSDLEYLKQATNCKVADLTDNRAITDLSFVNNMPNLKEIYLENDELITDFKPLIDHKAQFDKIFLPNQASDSVRKDLINTEEISLMKDDAVVVDAAKPFGLLKESDKVSVSDPEIAQAEIVIPEEEEESENDHALNPYLKVTGKKVGTTAITITMGSEKKTIKVDVTDPESKKARFNENSTTMKLGTFKKYKFENVESSDIQSVKFTCDGNAVEMIDNKDGTYTPVAKNEGTSKVSAEITLKDGNIKEVKEATFTVTKSDENTVVIKDYDLYKGMMNNGKSADADQDGMISKDEIKNVDEIVVQNSNITDLTGVEEAINCKKVDFTNDGQLKDINVLGNLKELTSVILKFTAVNDINVLNNLTNLKNIELRDNNVSEKDQLALLKLSDVSMIEGESRTQEITPSGIVGDTSKVDVADTNVATAQIRNGSLIITGKAAGTTTVSIYNDDKASAKTIAVNVAKKPQEPTKPKPQVVKVSKITLSAPVTNVAPGKKVKIKATVTPTKAANKAVTWSTSNKKLATVDKNGTVTFNKKAGGKSVTITATAKDGSKKKSSIKFKVAKGEVKKITITGKKTLNVGKTLTLKGKVTATKGANKKLKWTSSNTKYATVSSSGKVKALKAGKKKTVTITAAATDGTGKKATIKIKIK